MSTSIGGIRVLILFLDVVKGTLHLVGHASHLGSYFVKLSVLRDFLEQALDTSDIRDRPSTQQVRASVPILRS